MRYQRFALFLALGLAGVAQAYIGPGAGISVVGSLIGVVVTIVLAIGAVIAWPVRRMLRRRRAGKSGTDTPPKP